MRKEVAVIEVQGEEHGDKLDDVGPGE